jgi:hypothetical protein
MIKCFNCGKDASTCKHCGFDYCELCFNDASLHEPCPSTQKKTNIFTCFICCLTFSTTIDFEPQQCHCIVTKHNICYLCFIFCQCALCNSKWPCNDTPCSC